MTRKETIAAGIEAWFPGRNHAQRDGLDGETFWIIEGDVANDDDWNRLVDLHVLLEGVVEDDRLVLGSTEEE